MPATSTRSRTSRPVTGGGWVTRTSSTERTSSRATAFVVRAANLADIVASKEWLTAPKSAKRWLSCARSWLSARALLLDGQLGPGEEATFHRRFTPRRPGSSWSKRNVALVKLLTRQERMQPAGRSL
jgi:hypothetical protein